METEELFAVIGEVKTCAVRLNALTHDIHQDLGITPAMRVIMESLAIEERQTVHEMAMDAGISSSRIQFIVESLLICGCVESTGHERGLSRYSLTEKGLTALEVIQVCEEDALRDMAAGASWDTLHPVYEGLRRLNRDLVNELVADNRRNTIQISSG